MKNVVLLIFALGSISICGFSQTATQSSAPDTNNITFSYAESMPEFIYNGGFNGYMRDSIIYPAAEIKKGTEGTVYISFIVEADGAVTNVKEKRGIPGAPALTDEAIRVISEMPKWRPMLMKGIPTRVEMVMPVKFIIGMNATSDSKKKKHK